MRLLHSGHIEDGRTMDIPRGMRYMQTLRKLPTTAPKMKGTIKIILSANNATLRQRPSGLFDGIPFKSRDNGNCAEEYYKVWGAGVNGKRPRGNLLQNKAGSKIFRQVVLPGLPDYGEYVRGLPERVGRVLRRYHIPRYSARERVPGPGGLV